jgi:hypothetical protein
LANNADKDGIIISILQFSRENGCFTKSGSYSLPIVHMVTNGPTSLKCFLEEQITPLKITGTQRCKRGRDSFSPTFKVKIT